MTSSRKIANKIISTKKVVGSKSLERFVHFQCGTCNKWWGIGDAPARKEWYCPWCATKQSFIDKTPKNIG